MISTRDTNAMAEVLHYLKGIRQEDVDKIQKKLIQILKENASKDYICNFDYNKPLKELELLDETRGLISMLCLNYWCRTEEEKQNYINRLNQNEIKYQEELRQKYNPDDIFTNNILNNVENDEENKVNIQIIEYKPKNIFLKILNKLKEFLNKKKATETKR